MNFVQKMIVEKNSQIHKKGHYCICNNGLKNRWENLVIHPVFSAHGVVLSVPGLAGTVDGTDDLLALRAKLRNSGVHIYVKK